MDADDDGGLVLDDLQRLALAVGGRHHPVAVGCPSGPLAVAPAGGLSAPRVLTRALGLDLRRDPERGDHDRGEPSGLGGEHLDAAEAHVLLEPRENGGPARQARDIVSQHDVELAGLRRPLHVLPPFASEVVTTRLRSVGEGLHDRPVGLARGELGAAVDLVAYGERVLLLVGVAGVDGDAHAFAPFT